MTDTELVLTGGERLRVEGDAKRVESAIVSAARGSILELAWLTESGTRRRVGINPDRVLMIRALDDVEGQSHADLVTVPASGLAGDDLDAGRSGGRGDLDGTEPGED
ncbi:MAG: hypothetical protein ABI355_16130 [Solirubrobacteraceae bacterium]